MEINVKTKYDVGDCVFYLNNNHVAQEAIINEITVKYGSDGKIRLSYLACDLVTNEYVCLFPKDIFATANDVKDTVLKDIMPLINFV